MARTPRESVNVRPTYNVEYTEWTQGRHQGLEMVAGQQAEPLINAGKRFKRVKLQT